jgi:hypothetical protein
VVLPEDGDAALCHTDRVRLRFELPGEDGPLEFAGRIRRRALHSSAILYGIGFEEEDTANFDLQAELVARYALSLQVEMLKRAREERDAA